MSSKSNHVGYLGVVIPDRDFWQGYFIDDAFAPAARDALAKIRANERLRDSSTTWAKVSGVADADQPIVGSMCATIVDTVLSGGPNRLFLVGSCAYVIRELTGADYFWIEGRGSEAGVSTTISLIRAATIEEARTTINSLPIVTAIKLRLLNRIASRSTAR